MALPVLNEAPKYELVIPSTKKKINYRPFLVKEQKILLIAYESQDRKQIVQAMLDTIAACAQNVDIMKLTTFDVDYIFTQIRSKSVGEKVELNVNCNECSVQNLVTVNLDEIDVDVPGQNMIVPLTDTISLKLKYPDYGYYMSSPNFFNLETQSELMTEIVISCIDSVMTEEESISIKDEAREEVIKFIDSLSPDQFDKISKFVETLPTVRHNLEFKCVSCGVENSRVLEGLDDFF